jgi:hypothetical protein
MTATATATGPSVKRHPIRGFFWGLLAGIGVALILVNFAVIALGTLAPPAVALAGAVLGIAWGLFAPAKGGRPAAEPPMPPAAPPMPPPGPGAPPAPGGPTTA